MLISKEKKIALVNDYGINPKDTGNTSVQVALLTGEIQALTEHLKVARKDFSSRQGLFRMVGQRRSLLNYLKANKPDQYQKLIQQLDLRK